MQGEGKKEGYQKYPIYDEHGGGEGAGFRVLRWLCFSLPLFSEFVVLD